MSCKVVALVRDRAFGDSTLKALLEVLADSVDDDGRYAGDFPGLQALADDLDVSTEVVQRALRRARDQDLIAVDVLKGGRARIRFKLSELLARPLTATGRRRFASGLGGAP